MGENELERHQKKLNGPKNTAKHTEAKKNWINRESKSIEAESAKLAEMQENLRVRKETLSVAYEEIKILRADLCARENRWTSTEEIRNLEQQELIFWEETCCVDERRIDRGDRQLDDESTETQKDADKLVCLTEFLYEFDLRADNTWTEVATPTRRAWSSVKNLLVETAEEESQIDFLLSSSSIHLEDCCDEQSLHFRSDHWPIVSNYVFGSPNYSDHERFKRCPVKWSPSEFWSHRVNEFSADWTDPLSAFGQWAQIARECRLPAGREVVFQDNLQDLLQLRRQHLDSDWRRQVSHAIYRTRRKRKRFMQFRALKEACASGRAPPVQSECGHLNWSRFFGNDTSAEKLTSHFSAIFEFDNLEEAARECVVRQSLMQRWHSRPAGSEAFVCDLPSLELALKRLHLVKSFPMGSQLKCSDSCQKMSCSKWPLPSRKCPAPCLMKQAGQSSLLR